MTPAPADLVRTIDPVELGGRLRQAREGASLTQAHVAGADISVAHLSRIERLEIGSEPADLGLRDAAPDAFRRAAKAAAAGS